MKKSTIFSLMMATFALSSVSVSAEEASAGESTRRDEKVAAKAAKGEAYRRSSLCMIMIEDPTMPKVEVIRDAIFAAQTPNKYNDHNVGNRAFSIEDIEVDDTDVELFKAAILAGNSSEKAAADFANESGVAEGESKGGGFRAMAGSLLSDAASGTSAGAIEFDDKMNIAVQAYKFMRDQDLGYEIARKWFTDESGRDTMELVRFVDWWMPRR